MTVALAPAPKFKAFDNNGMPLLGGQLQTLVAGSTTPQATYIDSTQTTPNTNPVILNQRGEADLWLVAGQTYKLVLSDSVGNLIWSVDNIPGGINAAAIGQFLYPVTVQETAAGIVPTNFQYPTLNVLRYGADPVGTADSTTAINNAIQIAKQYTNGATVYMPAGIYKSGQIDMSTGSAIFSRSIRLQGDGFASQIIPNAAGIVQVSLLGTNQAQINSLQFTASTPIQCAIYLARTTASQNCGYNNFKDLWFNGQYTKACVVSVAAENGFWQSCLFQNASASSPVSFWTGGGTGANAAIAISGATGGTPLDSTNTNQGMSDCQFYTAFGGVTTPQPIIFWGQAGYSMNQCSVITGTLNNCKLATYVAPPGIGVFSGPVTWQSAHMESNGTGNIIHWLVSSGTSFDVFNGINNYGGYYQTNNNTTYLDFDRTLIVNQPVLQSSTWTTPQTNNNETNIFAYIYAMFSCSFTMKPFAGTGTLILSGFAQQSTIDVSVFSGPGTRFVSGGLTQFIDSSTIPTTGTYTIGQRVLKDGIGGLTLPTSAGWICTMSGTLGTLTGITGSVAVGTNVLTLNSVTGVSEGNCITVAGSSGGPYYIRKLVGTTAYLDANSGATVSGAAVAYSNAVLSAMANI